MTSPSFYFYTLDTGTDSLCTPPTHLRKRRPLHQLDLRLPPRTSLEQAQVNRDDLLLQRRIKLHQRFIQVQRTVQAVKARREKQAMVFLQSLENAEKNRMGRLEARRAVNKQLVDRAKSIAHQHRSQTKAERERRRIELERRLEASEIRRLNYLGLSKSTMASRMNQEDNDDNNNNNDDDNEVLISQKKTDKYRRHGSSPSPASPSSSSSLATLLHSFHHLGLPIIGQQDTWLGFHALGRLIRQQDVISITGKVLNLALGHHRHHHHHNHHHHNHHNHHCHHYHHQQRNSNNNNKPRVFLSAYMMIMCPHDILQSPESPDEIILLESAKDLLQKFETWLDHPQRRQKRVSFVDSWTTFHALFDQWKSKDRDQLVASMIGYYLELMSVQHVIHPTKEEEDDDDDDDDEEEEEEDDDGTSQDVSDMLTLQMEQLKARIGKLGGDAAIQSLQDQIHQVPIAKKKKKKGKMRRQQEQPLAKTDKATCSMNEMSRLMNDMPHTSLLTNAQLAHELILNPDFQLQPTSSGSGSGSGCDDGEDSLETRVRSITLRAYFDSVIQDIQHGQYKTTLLPLIHDIRKKLLSMVEKGKPAYQTIHLVMDMTLIEQQMEHKSFDLGHMITTILTCQRRLCAPHRDATLDQIQARANDPGWQLEQIMGLLDTMHLDLANFRLRSLQPYLAPMAVEYEQQQFCAEYHLVLGSGSGNDNANRIKERLPRLYQWMGQALVSWQQGAKDRNPEHVHSSRNNHHSSPKELVYDALLGAMTTTTTTSDNKDWPETFHLDRQRLDEFADLAQQIITVASLVMVAKNMGKVTSPTSLSTLSQTLFTLLPHRPSSQHITAELLRVTPPHTNEWMASIVARILARNDTVYALLGRRVAAVLKHQLINHHCATEAVLVSSSLEYVHSPLQQLATRLDAFCHHHIKVHLPWYSLCLTQLQQ